MDGLLVGVIAFFAVRGTIKGFAKSAFSLLSFIAAILLAFCFCTKLSFALANGCFLKTAVYDAVSSVLKSIDVGLTEQKFFSANEMQLFLNSLDLPLYAKSFLLMLVGKIHFVGSFSIEEAIKEPIYHIFLKLFSFLMIFLVVFLILKIIQMLVLKKIKFKFFVVSNRAFGFLLGIGMGVLVYGTIVLLLVSLSQFVLSDFLIKKIEEGHLSSIIFNKFGDKIIAFVNDLF